jgi:hypothetical protein
MENTHHGFYLLDTCVAPIQFDLELIPKEIAGIQRVAFGYFMDRIIGRKVHSFASIRRRYVRSSQQFHHTPSDKIRALGTGKSFDFFSIFFITVQ